MPFSAMIPLTHPTLIRTSKTMIRTRLSPARRITNLPENATVKFGRKNSHLTGYFSHPDPQMNQRKGKQQNA